VPLRPDDLKETAKRKFKALQADGRLEQGRYRRRRTKEAKLKVADAKLKADVAKITPQAVASAVLAANAVANISPNNPGLDSTPTMQMNFGRRFKRARASESTDVAPPN
jgi:hypothetical protein